MRRLLDRLFPGRVCRRVGHDPVGFTSMGPHLNNPEKGPSHGVFYALRYVVRCRRCHQPCDPAPDDKPICATCGHPEGFCGQC